MANLTINDLATANVRVVEKPKKASQAVHDMVVALRANRRSGTANTKTRSEMTKSDKKPYRQKGTGNARAGTKNSPIWCGGSVVFGPKPRDYSKKVNKSTKRLALAAALSSRVQAGDVVSVSEFKIADGKTASFVKHLASLSDATKTLIIAAAFDEQTYLAGRNHGNALLMTASEVNVEHFVTYHKIIVTTDALPVLSARTAKA